MKKKLLSAVPESVSRRLRTQPIVRKFQALRHDSRGSAAVLAAVLFPVVIGGMGLGAETGYWYLKDRMLQHVTDVTAHAAGARKRAGDSRTQIEAAALSVASKSGFEPGTMVVNMPPVGGAYAGDANSVEVLIDEVYPRLFSALFGSDPVTVRSRAVSRIVSQGQACVLALSRTAPGAITVSGSTDVGLENCDVASNSAKSDSFLMSGNSPKLTTGCVQAAGQAVTTSGLTLTACSAVREHAPIVRDPYASVAEPAAVGTCRNANVGSPTGSTTLTPTENHPSGVKSMRFCKGLDVKGKITFEPGLYIIEGGTFSINGGDVNSTSAAELIGAGVTFYLGQGASLKLNGNVTMNLSAPTSGPFAGLLFFGSRNATSTTHIINGTASTTLQGAVYAPASLIEFKGNSSTSGGCTQVIGDRIKLTGNSSLRSTCDAAGTRKIETNEIVTLVE